MMTFVDGGRMPPRPLDAGELAIFAEYEEFGEL